MRLFSLDLASSGFDLQRLYLSLRLYRRFLRNYREFRRLSSSSKSQIPIGDSKPFVLDFAQAVGTVDPHYFNQDLWVAKRVFLRAPRYHMDVGSRMDGLVAHIASFRQIEVIDIRPPLHDMHGIGFRQLDMMEPLPMELLGCCDSLSCLHVIEHFGLSRYGDPINPDGHLVGYSNLVSMLEVGGILYLSVPIGPLRVEFNAHRVFSIQYLMELFSKNMELISFSFVHDDATFHREVMLNEALIRSNCNCQFGCGIFELRRIR